MLPSFLSTLFWGRPSQEEEVDQEGVTTEDGEEGWLLVNRARESAGSSSSTGQQDWDMESMASDGSWVLMPATTFTGGPATAPTHPMEDLLIEHPTMSVYQQPGSSDQGQEQDNSDLEVARLDSEVAVRNRQRTELAQHLQIPLQDRAVWVRGANRSKQGKLTRRALKRQNINNYKGGKQVNKVHKIPPGKRRC